MLIERLVVMTVGAIVASAVLGRIISGRPGCIYRDGGYRLYAIALLITGSAAIVFGVNDEYLVSRVASVVWGVASIAAFVLLIHHSNNHRHTSH